MAEPGGTRFAQLRVADDALTLDGLPSFRHQPAAPGNSARHGTRALRLRSAATHRRAARLADGAAVGRQDPAGHHRGAVPRLSLVIVDATDDTPAATWREWFARQRAAAPYRLWEWYQAADYERFRREGADPFEPIDVTPLVQRPTCSVSSRCASGSSIASVRRTCNRCGTRSLDVMLRFGFRIVKGEILEAAPYGMWSLHHDDNRSYRGGPALFWEMYERNPESGTMLQMLTDALDGGKVLYRSIGRHQLRVRLHKNRRATLLEERGVHDAAPRGPAPRRVGRSAGARHLQRTEHVHARDLSAADQPPDVALPGEDVRLSFPAEGGRQPRGAVGARVPAPWHRTIDSRSSTRRRTGSTPTLSSPSMTAAPSCSSRTTRTSTARARSPARSSARTASASRKRCSPARITCRIPRSSSGAASGSCCRKQARDGEWRSGARAGSPTSGSSRPSPWTESMPATRRCGSTTGAGGCGSRSASPAARAPMKCPCSTPPTPLGPWRPHRANPIISDAAHARPAGALYRDGDALIRPSQDARGGYGHAVTLSRIDRLTPSEYSRDTDRLDQANMAPPRTRHAHDRTVVGVRGRRGQRAPVSWSTRREIATNVERQVDARPQRVRADPNVTVAELESQGWSCFGIQYRWDRWSGRDYRSSRLDSHEGTDNGNWSGDTTAIVNPEPAHAPISSMRRVNRICAPHVRIDISVAIVVVANEIEDHRLIRRYRDGQDAECQEHAPPNGGRAKVEHYGRPSADDGERNDDVDREPWSLVRDKRVGQERSAHSEANTTNALRACQNARPLPTRPSASSGISSRASHQRLCSNDARERSYRYRPDRKTTQRVRQAFPVREE